MKCTKCNSENVKVNVINEVKLKKGHSGLWWLLIGWWYKPIMYICFGLWYLLFVLIFKKKTIKNKMVKVATCQECGNTWKIK